MSAWDQLEQHLEEQWEEESCPHGIHPDSGHPCTECMVEARPEPWEKEYQQWLTTVERQHDEE